MKKYKLRVGNFSVEAETPSRLKIRTLSLWWETNIVYFFRRHLSYPGSNFTSTFNQWKGTVIGLKERMELISQMLRNQASAHTVMVMQPMQCGSQHISGWQVSSVIFFGLTGPNIGVHQPVNVATFGKVRCIPCTSPFALEIVYSRGISSEIQKQRTRSL